MKRPAKYFRAGVGAVVADSRGRVLALERSDYRGAWQLPQGGLEKGETPLEGVYREVVEETGLKRRALKMLGRYPELLVYELPAKAQSKKTGMGQVQYWFLLAVKKDPQAAPRPPKGEFRAARWVPFSRVVFGAAPFRKPVYEKVQAYFEMLFPAARRSARRVKPRATPQPGAAVRTASRRVRRAATASR
jgi:putative (di)nucleoside polyphosphate hydrolase